METVGGQQFRDVLNAVVKAGAQPVIPIHKEVIMWVEQARVFEDFPTDKGRRLGDRVVAPNDEVVVAESGLSRAVMLNRRPVSMNEQRIAKHNSDLRMVAEI